MTHPFPMFPQDPLKADDPRLAGRTVQTFGPWSRSGVTEDGWQDVYTQEIALGRFGDGKCPPLWWTLQLHANEIVTPAPGVNDTSLTPDAIATAGLRTTKQKARIRWQDRSGGGKNSGNMLDVDIAAGATLQIGPCQRLDVSILSPVFTRQVDGGGQGQGAIPAGVEASLNSRVSVSAAANPWQSIPRCARLSHAVLVPNGLQAIIPIPAGACSAIVYQTTTGPRTFPSLVLIESGGLNILDGGQGQGFGIGTRYTRFESLPGQASHITTGAAGGQARTYTVVFNLEY